MLVLCKTTHIWVYDASSHFTISLMPWLCSFSTILMLSFCTELSLLLRTQAFKKANIAECPLKFEAFPFWKAEKITCQIIPLTAFLNCLKNSDKKRYHLSVHLIWNSKQNFIDFWAPEKCSSFCLLLLPSRYETRHYLRFSESSILVVINCYRFKMPLKAMKATQLKGKLK